MKTKGFIAAILLTQIPCLHAESFTTNIIDGIWTNAGPQLTLGATGPFNFLLITNGGRLTNDGISTNIVGDAAVAHSNSAVVTGTNSVWDSGYLFFLGNTGALNRVSVLNDALFRSGVIYAGFRSSSNQLNVHDAVAGFGFLVLGKTSNANFNVVSFDGPKARGGSDSTFVGRGGASNTLVIRNGAQFTVGSILGGVTYFGIGESNFSNGNSVEVLGAGSKLSSLPTVRLGVDGSGNRLLVDGGGQIHSAGGGVIGENSGWRNSALVSGHGSQWIMTNELVVGHRASSSSLVISNGGFVRSHSGHLGLFGSTIGQGSRCLYGASFSSVHVTGPDSIWAMADSLVVGGNAVHNRVLITDGGRVAAQNVIIGSDDGGVTADPDCRVGEGGLSFLNELEIAGGALRAGNFGPDLLEVRYGTLRLRSGAVNAGQLLVTSRWSRLELFGGALTCSEAIVNNGLPLVIGNGLHNARLHARDIAAPGGAVIWEHAVLESSGRISAAVTNFGTLSPLGFGTFVASNYYQQPAGTLVIDIALQRAELLSVTNVAVLNGKLLLQRGSDPPSNNVTIVRAGALSGAFNNATNGARIKTTDNLGSYRVEYTATSVVLRDFQSTDLDGDMIEDAWATLHFGHSPLTPAEKAADDDGDGSSNYDEFVAGTDPKNSASALRASIFYANGGATVTFSCQEEKRYNISWSSDLITWNHVSDPTFNFAEPGACRWTDDGRSTGSLSGQARFFRVSVE